MATIEELEQQAEATYVAEGAAMMGLVAAMRELAVQLPSGSRLATLLAKHSKDIESFAAPRGMGYNDGTGFPVNATSGFASVAVTANEIRRQQLEDWGAREAESA